MQQLNIYLSRHPRYILLYLLDLVNDLRCGRFKTFGFFKVIFGSPELSFVHHDRA